MKLPIYIFGPIELAKLSGQIRIEGVIKSGMIHFGSDEENIIFTKEPCRLFISGILNFKGDCKFAKATQLLVWYGGVMDIGEDAWFGTFTKIVVFDRICIGKNFMSSWECQLFDTDFHFIRSKADNTITNNTRPVIIGDRVWLGSRSTLLKGTILSSDTIVASSSVCNKNYSQVFGDSVMIGGVPAKLLKKSVEYIHDKSLERRLLTFFRDEKNKGKFFKD